MVTLKTIRDAYVFLRNENNTIPDETLDFMLQASLEKFNFLKADKKRVPNNQFIAGFVPTIQSLIKREEEHLEFLKKTKERIKDQHFDNMIKVSESRLEHFNIRLKEYTEYSQKQ